MTYSEICAAVAKLKVKYDETDPFRLCRAMGITLLLQPMGKHETAIKGFFMECKRIKTITVNSDLPEIVQKIIVSIRFSRPLGPDPRGRYAFISADTPYTSRSP